MKIEISREEADVMREVATGMQEVLEDIWQSPVLAVGTVGQSCGILRVIVKRCRQQGLWEESHPQEDVEKEEKPKRSRKPKAPVEPVDSEPTEDSPAEGPRVDAEVVA